MSARKRRPHRLDTLHRAMVRVASALRGYRIPTLGPADPPASAADEVGGVAACLDCHRELHKKELEIDPGARTLTPSHFCAWCARPR